MANVIVPNKPAKDVIRIDGVCYFLKGSTPNPPTHTNDDIDALYDDCDECAEDEFSSSSSPDFSNSSNSSSSVSIILPPEVLSESSSSGGLSSSSSSSFEISSGNPCYHVCVESDWSIADLNGTYTYNTVTEKWEQEGGDGTLYFDEGLDKWFIAHPSSNAIDGVVYEAEIPHNPCPPLNGWTFVPSALGTQTLLSISDGTCEEVQSSESSSFSRSESSSSQGLSSSSSSSSSSDSSSSQSAVANACEGVTCPTVSGFVDPPSIQLTIEKPDYFLGDPSITWCGKTWTPTEIQNGVTKCVCPTLYREQFSFVNSITYIVEHGWGHLTTTNTLYMYRRVDTCCNFPAIGDFINSVRALGGALKDRHRAILPNWPPATPTHVPASFAILEAVAKPTYNSYQLTDDFFSSHTLSGVTYTWEKGINWP